jgi:DNA-directed RNA polymerase subunit H (RpoH/RPB5)
MDSQVDTQVEDILIRSRNTVLEILTSRGYDVSLYSNIAPDQLVTLMDKPRALDIYVPKKEGSAAPCPRAVVVHVLQGRINPKQLPGFIESLFTIPADGKGTTKVETTDDIIVLINEPWNEAFDKESLSQWQTRRIRITFFLIKQLVVNPSRHVLVPPHRKLTYEESEKAMLRLHITSRIQMPQIKIGDIQAKILGLVPGDVIIVDRPSATAGISQVLRNCSS